MINRVLESLQLEMTHTCDMLGWSPPFSLGEGLRQTVDAW